VALLHTESSTTPHSTTTHNHTPLGAMQRLDAPRLQTRQACTDVLSTQLLPAGRLRPGKSTRKQLSTRAGPQICASTHKLTPCTPSRRGAASCVSGNRRRRSQGPAFPPTGGKRPRCHCTLAQLQSQCNEVLLNAFSAEVCLNDLTRWRAHMLCASTGPSVRVWRHERSCGARCRAGYQSSE